MSKRSASSSMESPDKKYLRSGKWSQEEEDYSNRLIYEFENGFLHDCEEGCSLRSYLAKKLSCAPMRVSKKLAGRCIGKLTYTRIAHAIPHSPDVLKNLESSYARSFEQQDMTSRIQPKKNKNESLKKFDSSRSDTTRESVSSDSDTYEFSNSALSPIGQSQFDTFDFFDNDMIYASDYLNFSTPSSAEITAIEQHDWQDILSSICDDKVLDKTDFDHLMKCEQLFTNSLNTNGFLSTSPLKLGFQYF